MKKFIQIFICIIILSSGIYSQKNDIKFEHLYEGLSQKSALCITQDSKGFMWFGWSGLGGIWGFEGLDNI